MKLICIAGPRAAGKEELKKHLEAVFGLRRIVAHTERAMRGCEQNGREYHFVSRLEINALLRSGQLVVRTKVSGNLYGTTYRELWGDCSDCVVDIVPENARIMKREVEGAGGKTFLVFIHASEAERRGRICARQPGITEAELAKVLASEPAPTDDLSLYRDFDLVIENPDGCLQETLASAERSLRQFLA